VVCSATTKKHQECIASLVTARDSVLVVCVAKAGGNSDARGLGRGNDDAAAARATGAAGVTVTHGSAWDIASLIALEREAASGGFTVVSVNDDCGNDLFSDNAALLRTLKNVFEATLHTVLIKSKGLGASMNCAHNLPRCCCTRYHACVSSQTCAAELHARSFHNADRFMAARLPRNVREAEVQVICAEGVADYRGTVPLAVRPGDKVLEIGCGDGPSTQL
jgi:hypothetical protein